MYDGYWLRMERQQREARGRASARPPREVGEGLRALGIKSEALEGQCDCESLFCEEARDHRPGHCPRPPQSYVRAFGIRTKLCGQCITRWGQTAGTDMRVIGSDDRRKDICICTHSRDDHDEKGYCDCCECNGYTPREKAKEASMSGSNTVGYTIKGRAKVSSFSTPENVGRFVEAAIGKWGKDFSLGRPLGKRGGAVRDWDAGQYGEASNAVETLRSNGIQATLHFHGGGVELVVPDGEEDRAQQLLGGSASWRPDVEPPKEPSWMRYFKRDYKGEPVTSGISQAGPGRRPEHIRAGSLRCPLCRFSTKDPAMFSKHAGDEHLNPEMHPKRAGFNFFFPGQALREFYPEIQHEIVDYPNATNAPMTSEVSGDSLNGPLYQGGDDDTDHITAALEGTFDSLTKLSFVDAGPNTSTSPAGGALGLSGKSLVTEGTPLHEEDEVRNSAEPDSFYRYRQDGPPGGAFRTEDQSRGGMFEEEFYQHYDGQPGGDALSQLASEQERPKTAAATGDYKAQLGRFLKRVVAEIAAAFISAWKMTGREPLDKAPGTGEVQLDQVEQQQQYQGLSSLSLNITKSRVKYLVEKLSDSELQEILNDCWAQAAVWCSSPNGGYVREVFVRAETLDSSLNLKYRFVTGTRD